MKPHERRQLDRIGVKPSRQTNRRQRARKKRRELQRRQEKSK